MLAQGRLRDAEHARNVRFRDAVGGHHLGLPPLRVSRGPDRWSHWKIRPLRSATNYCTVHRVHLSARRLSKMVARYRREDLLAVHAASQTCGATPPSTRSTSVATVLSPQSNRWRPSTHKS